MQEMGDDCLGLRVVVKAKGAVYMGVINYILPPSRRLALEQVRLTCMLSRLCFWSLDIKNQLKFLHYKDLLEEQSVFLSVRSLSRYL